MVHTLLCKVGLIWGEWDHLAAAASQPAVAQRRPVPGPQPDTPSACRPPAPPTRRNAPQSSSVPRAVTAAVDLLGGVGSDFAASQCGGSPAVPFMKMHGVKDP